MAMIKIVREFNGERSLYEARSYNRAVERLDGTLLEANISGKWEACGNIFTVKNLATGAASMPIKIKNGRLGWKVAYVGANGDRARATKNSVVQVAWLVTGESATSTQEEE